MQMYSGSSTASFASTNGFISLDHGSAANYQAQRLPDANLPNNTVAPFFDDLEIYASSSPPQGIFYQFTSANTSVTYEYYLGRAGYSNQTYHFTVTYSSLVPNVFTYQYYSVGNSTAGGTGGAGSDGVYAAVGMQGLSTSGTLTGYTYSFQTGDITPGLVLTCSADAAQNSCTASTAT